jgi:Sulfatase
VGTYHQIPLRSSKLAPHIQALWKATGLAYWLPFVVFYAVLANIPFWVACPWLGIFRNAWFCLEYVAIGLLALFVPRLVTACLLLLVTFLDLLDGVCQTYFMVPSQCLANLSAVRQFSFTRLLAGAIVSLLILLFAAATAFLPTETIKRNYRWRTAACLIGFAALSLSVDGRTVFRRTGGVLNYLHPKPAAQDAFTASSYRVLFSRVPTIRLVRKEIAHAKNVERERRYPKSAVPVRSATAQAISSSGITAGKNSQDLPNLVVVVVESWGLNSESAVSNALVSAYAQPDLSARYEVLQGTVPFYGSTVPGEARELCGNMMGFHLLDASSQELQGCLPDRLAALGYHGVAMHGMEGHMFNRSAWYKTIGFQETWFKDQFQKQGLPSCVGVFTGTCDAAIAKWMGHRLETRKAGPDFLYWMTLDSHLPVRIPVSLPSPASCSFTSSLSQYRALCSWYQLVANVHQSVAGLAMSNLARPTVFAIVGDHAPPFNDPEIRTNFSYDVVPYVLLVPRNQSDHAGQIMNLEGK